MDFFGARDTLQYYDTKMLMKVVFVKTAFVKFKISNNFKENIDETHSKQQNILKIFSLAYGSLFTVISISGRREKYI